MQITAVPPGQPFPERWSDGVAVEEVLLLSPQPGHPDSWFSEGQVLIRSAVCTLRVPWPKFEKLAGMVREPTRSQFTASELELVRLISAFVGAAAGDDPESWRRVALLADEHAKSLTLDHA